MWANCVIKRKKKTNSKYKKKIFMRWESWSFWIFALSTWIKHFYVNANKRHWIIQQSSWSGLQMSNKNICSTDVQKSEAVIWTIDRKRVRIHLFYKSMQKLPVIFFLFCIHPTQFISIHTIKVIFPCFLWRSANFQVKIAFRHERNVPVSILKICFSTVHHWNRNWEFNPLVG